MNLKKNETNNCIITTLCNVRAHPNADRLKLATVLGTQVIVGLDAKDGDLVLYFDSNLRLSHNYLHYNNLYSSPEMNNDTNVKGYFGKNGRVRAQKFRGEISNGYVADLSSIDCVPGTKITVFEVGDEFTSVDGVEICSKYIVPTKSRQGQPRKPISKMFHKHWDTKQLMRESQLIPPNAKCYIEEKIHGTSGRTGNVLCDTNRPWWKFWLPKEEWRVVSGTRRVDNIDFHMPQERKEIHDKIAPHLHKGEEVYYEIYGTEIAGADIQTGFRYGCRPGEFKAMLYRVTITTPDGHMIDLNRKQVYQRAEELGLEKPTIISIFSNVEVCAEVISKCYGKSKIDAGTLLEGVVVWYENISGSWHCLKHKSEEFLLLESKNRDKEIGDVEDEN